MGLIVGALAERIRFSAVLIFVVVWLTLSYVPIAHMVWGGGLLATHGALDFAGGTVVHINAAVAGLVGAYLIGKRVGFGKEAFKPHNLPMVFTGTAILYFGWFGFNAGSASAANEIAALAFVNTVVATAGAILSWYLVSGLFAVNPPCWEHVLVRLPVWLVSPLRVVMSVSAGAAHRSGGGAGRSVGCYRTETRSAR